MPKGYCILPNLQVGMESKIKYVTFHTKKYSDLYKNRTCSPYKYPKCGKVSVPVRKVLCKYKKIITKNCRINDILKFMDTDPLFPINTEEYINLLVEVIENSTCFFNSLAMMKGNNDGLKVLRLAFYPIQDSYQTIQTLLYNELEGTYSYDIKYHFKILKLNLVSCIEIIKDKNNISGDRMVTHVVQDLEHYISNLKTICNFICLVILKKKSSVVQKMLSTISYTSSEIHICSICGKIEINCRCFAGLGSTSNENDDDDDDFSSSELQENLDVIENVPHCSRGSPNAELEDDDFWQRYLKTYGFVDKESNRDSPGSSTDTD